MRVHRDPGGQEQEHEQQRVLVWFVPALVCMHRSANGCEDM